MTLPHPGQLDLPLSTLRQIDEVCTRFEAVWQAGDEPRIEDYLAGTDGAARAWLFRELLLAEVEVRTASGATLHQQDYRDRFPEFADIIHDIIAGPVADRLGPYEVITLLGQGGMGKVYRARDTRLGREVAVKVLPDEFARDPGRLARFEQEARAVAKLAHPNVIVLHDIGAEQGRPFVVMELLHGESLRQRLAGGPLPLAEALALGADIAGGLAAVHAAGVVHRDVKPENLFVTGDGRVKVLDFGLARVEDPAATPTTERAAPALTGSGVVLGTVGYMAPEQVRGQPADARSDVFALGCVLYEMLTGRRAFQRASAAETQTAILRDEPPGLSASGSALPAEVCQVVRRCLAKEPAERFPSAAELAQALRGLQEQTRRQGDREIGRQKAGDQSPRLHWRRSLAWLAVLTALGVLAVGGSLLIKFGGSPRPERKPIESLAVLPFHYHGGDPDADFARNNIAFPLIQQLRKRQDVKVMAFSAVTDYTNGPADVPRAFRDLGVQAVLHGSVEETDGLLRITVELVGPDNEHLWGDQHTLPPQDLYKVPDKIARALMAVLAGEEPPGEARPPTENAEAFRACILGQVKWSRRTRESMQEALEDFERAAGLDAQYADAHAGRAFCYITLAERDIKVPQRGVHSPADAYKKAWAAADEARQIDDNLADAHVALGMIAFEHDWDFAAAEREFRRALELDPSHPTGRQWYAEYLSALGRPEEALRQIRAAQQYDPHSPIISTIEGVILYKDGRLDDAIAHLKGTLDRHPVFPRAHGYLAAAYEQNGLFNEAAEHWSVVVDGDPAVVAPLREAARSGDPKTYWQARRDLWEPLTRRHSLSDVFLAGVHASLGDKDAAFAVLNRAYQRHDGALAPNLKVNPCFRNLRGDPRYEQLLRDMKFPE